MNQRWGSKGFKRKNQIIKKIMSIPRAKGAKELQSNIITFRKYCNDFSTEFGTEYDEASRKVALMGLCPEKLEEDLIMNERNIFFK